MTVAEQVVAVLRGEFPRGAVNIPVGAGEDAGELMPYVDLCSQLGRLVVQLAEGTVDAVEVTYGGSFAYFDTEVLTLGVLAGVLAGRVDGPVNYVNARSIAAECGVRASEERESDMSEFPRLITVATAGREGAVSVSGTSLGREHKPRLVRVFGEEIDIVPAPRMAFLRYVDLPGVGGKLGTLLGEWGVNIGHMSVGRGRLGDEAVMALTLDEPLTAGQVDELVSRCGLLYARAVQL
jgi:D-3-phosphoglycerate dehydrogenase